jgi:predicted O-methyltransferase YrrM
MPIIDPYSIYAALDIPEAERSTSITPDEGLFIFKFLSEQHIHSTLEIGFAFGCSAAYIMAATNSTHYAIDPYADQYRRLGIKNLEQFGIAEHLVLKKDFSHAALSELVKQGLKCDFVFVDGDHRFDFILVDFHFVDLLLNQGGYVLFHDVWMKSVLTVAHWIETNRSDYSHVAMPTKNLDLILFQKTGSDERAWDHFEEFLMPANAASGPK